MSQKTLPGLKPKRPIRRSIRIQARNGDQIICKTKSQSIASGVEYHPSIDLKTFGSHCDCPASVYRPNLVCKHRVKAALNLIRRGELDPIWLERAGNVCCHKCGENDDRLYPMCASDGSHLDGVWICYPCIEGLRAEKKGLTRAPSAEETRANAEIQPFPDADELALSVCGCGHISFSDEMTCNCDERESDEIESRRVSNCPCGRRFPGRDFDHVCPTCNITLRAAWQRHRAVATRAPRSEADYARELAL